MKVAYSLKCWFHAALYVVFLLSTHHLIAAAARELTTTTAKDSYALVLFGDSLTDTGRTFALSGFPDPRYYYNGRFTNGPNWVDYLSGEVQKKANLTVWNYAYGGATACRNAVVDTLPFVRDAQAQTAAFLADVAAGRLPPGARPLVVQFVGDNDVQYYLDGLLQAGQFPTEQGVRNVLNATVTCRMQQLLAMASTGLVKDLVVLPPTPLELVPTAPPAIAPFLQQIVDGAELALTLGVRQVNQALAAAPPGSPLHGARVHQLGSPDWLGRLVGRVQPPITVLNSTCIQGQDSVFALVPPTATVCTNPNDYLVYDRIHPTTNYHKYFGLYGVLPRLQMLRLLPWP